MIFIDQLVNVGWHNNKSIHSCFLHLEVVAQRLVIYYIDINNQQKI